MRLVNQSTDAAIVRLRADQNFELKDQDGVTCFRVDPPRGDIFQRGGRIDRI